MGNRYAGDSVVDSEYLLMTEFVNNREETADDQICEQL